MSIKDLTGQRFGRLTVIRKTDKRGPDGGIVYECLCDCGNTCFVWNNKLTRKNHSAKRSCGCLQAEAHTTYIHGEAGTILYHKWTGMKDRCYNPNAAQYKYYGGRGISVCAEWLHDFSAFQRWALSAGYRRELSLDRIDPNGGYCPENCRWIALEDQQKNKRTVPLFTYSGETHTLPEWSEITGIKYGTLWKRIKNGWSIEKALTTTVGLNSK